MASIRERYRDIYEELKAHGPRYVDEQNLEPEVERELLDLIEKLPHPDVVTAWDVQDICDRIRAGELEWFYELVG